MRILFEEENLGGEQYVVFANGKHDQWLALDNHEGMVLFNGSEIDVKMARSKRNLVRSKRKVSAPAATLQVA